MYKHVSGRFDDLLVINKSKFISTCQGVSSEAEAKEFVESVRKEHSTATHNCYAYIFDQLGNALKFSDDGEPKGTAGMPILEVIRNKKLVYTAVVVTRYFGGIKLGAGGLVRAYTEGATRVLDKAKIVEMKEGVFFMIDVDYNMFKLVDSYLKEQTELVVQDVSYADKVNIVAVVVAEKYEQIASELVDITLGRGEIAEIERDYYGF